MSGEAMSFAGGIGIGEESTFGQPASITDWLLAQSEGFNYQRPETANAPIAFSSEVLETVSGLVSVGGNVALPAAATPGFGRLLKLASRSYSSSALPYSVAAKPTASTLSGGTVPVGDYIVAVCAVMLETATNRLRMTNPSPESDTVSVTSGNQIIQVSPVMPSDGDIPMGYAKVGSHGAFAVFVTSPGGASGSERFIGYSDGTSASWTWNGTPAFDPKASPLPPFLFLHRFGPGLSQPKSATMEMVNDNGSSQLYTGCVVNQMQISIKPSDRVSATFDFFAKQKSRLSPSSTPSPAIGGSLHGKNALVYIRDGSGLTVNNLCNAFDVTVGNKADRRYSFTGQDTVRAIRAKVREVKGNFDFDFESSQQLDDTLNRNSREVLVIVQGSPSYSSIDLGNKVALYACPYQLQIHVPNFVYDGHQGNLNGDNEIVEKLPFVPRMSTSAGYALELRLVTTTQNL